MNPISAIASAGVQSLARARARRFVVRPHGRALNGFVPVANPPEPQPADDFEAFIADRPTPQQFRVAFPDIELVLPDDLTTGEFRFDHSRYFAALDGDRRIVGGRFG
jgi:hypothetical protein